MTTIYGLVDNTGVLDVPSNSTLDVGDDSVSSATLAGAGTVLLPGYDNIAPGVSGAVLINLDDTIEGTGGYWHNGGNGGAIQITLVNEADGVVEAVGNGAGAGALNIDDGVTNEGMIAAIQGGSLWINSVTVDNTGGTLDANGSDDGYASEIVITDSIIQNGTVESSAGGAMLIDNSNLDEVGGGVLMIVGSVTVMSDDGLAITGTIDNTGSISINSGGTIYAGDTANGAAASLAGGGNVILSGYDAISSYVSGAVLTNVDDTIEGTGGYEHNGGNGGAIRVALVNDALGVVEAVGQGGDTGALDIYDQVTNYGTLAAISGGSLWIYSTIVNSGAIDANGGTVVDNGSISGPGDLDISNGGLVVLNAATNENTTFTSGGGTLEMPNAGGGNGDSTPYSGSVSANFGVEANIYLPNFVIGDPTGQPPDSGPPLDAQWTNDNDNPAYRTYLQIDYSGNSQGGVLSIVKYENYFYLDNSTGNFIYNYAADGVLFAMNMTGDYNAGSFTLNQNSGGFYLSFAGTTASYDWSKAKSGSWAVGANWTPTGPPSTLADVAIDVAGTYTVTDTQASTSVADIDIGDSGATLAISGGGEFSAGGGDIDGAVSVTAGSQFDLAGSLSFGAAGKLSASGAGATIDLSASAITDGTLAVRSGAVLDATGGGASAIVGATVTDASIVEATADSTLTLFDAIVNAAGGTLQATDGSGASIVLDGATVNAGTLTDSAGDSITTASSSSDGLNGVKISVGSTVTVADDATATLIGSVNDQGVIDVGSATLDLQGALIGAGSIELGAGATFDVDGSVGSGVTIQFTGVANPVSFQDASGFAGKFSSFGGEEMIDLVGFDGNTTLTGYAGNSTSGALTISDGAQSAKLRFVGDYALGGFVLSASPDGEYLTYYSPPSVAFAASAEVGATSSSGTAITLSGTATGGASAVESVALYNGAVDAADFLGDATLGGGGAWSLAVTLPTGTYSLLKAVATDVDGSTTSGSAPFQLLTGITTAPYVAVQTDDSSGKPASRTEYNADGSTYLQANWQYFSGGAYQITYTDIYGQAYNSYTEQFSSSGQPQSASYSNGMEETWTYYSGGAYQIVYTGVTGQDFSGDTTNYGSNGKATQETYNDGETLTWTYNSDSSYSIAATSVPSSIYPSSTTQYSVAGKPTSEIYYTAGGQAGQKIAWSYNPDGSYTAQYQDITGQAYTSATYSYGVNGRLTSVMFNDGMNETWTYAANGSYQIAYTGISEPYAVQYGTNGLAETATYSDGEVESWSYTSGGTIASIAYTDPSDSAFDPYTITYGANGRPSSANYQDGETETWTYGADDQLEQVSYQGVQNASYTALLDVYDSSQNLETSLSTNVGGTYTLTAYEGGLTLNATEPSETFYGKGNPNETFYFSGAFGHDTLFDFATQLTGSGHDTLSLPGAPFGDSFATLLADTTFGASGATIKVDSADTILVRTLTKTLMTANSTDFAFHN